MNWAVVREPTILVTAIVYGLLASLALLAGIFGIWLGMLVLISSWRYCYIVLRNVAQGHRHIPPPDIDSFNPIGEWAVFWHFVFFPGIVIATAPYQPLGMIVAVAAAVMFPASAALMGLTSSLAQAFNPAALIGFVRTVGPDYGTIVVANVAIFAGASLVVSFILPVLGFLSIVLSLIVEIWALLAIFALTGSVLRAHRLDFEIAGEVRPREEEFLARRHAEWRKMLDIAYASFRSGVISAGYKTLHELVDDNGDSIEVNHWLVENMLEWEDKRYALEVAVRLMPRLLERGDAAGTLELYQRCRRRDPEFRPPPVEAEQLAAHAAAFGQTGLANELSYNRDSV